MAKLPKCCARALASARKALNKPRQFFCWKHGLQDAPEKGGA